MEAKLDRKCLRKPCSGCPTSSALRNMIYFDDCFPHSPKQANKNNTLLINLAYILTSLDISAFPKKVNKPEISPSFQLSTA